MKDFSKEIKAYALRNAVEHGKADAGRILPKLFQHGLDKKDIKKVMPEIAKIVKEVNSLSAAEKEEMLLEYGGYAKEHEVHKEGELPELENAVLGKVVTRLAPEPSKYLHIGHALVFIIQYMYAKKYGGKCLLRFDDTNPEKCTLEFYNAMKEDLSWLGIKWERELLASDDIPVMYKYAEKLVEDGRAFVCECRHDEMKALREKMKECVCRKKTSRDNLKEWAGMLKGDFEESSRTLRLKGDMKSNNGVMRDPVIFRITGHMHFKQGRKYIVWPMYDFESPIEDSLNGITHIIRSNEFELRAELHEFILKLLKLRAPKVREIGRYQITGAETQGRVIREMLARKEIMGWDDPRLVTIKALRRRGFVPEMFYQLAGIAGLSKTSGHIDPNVLASINRKIIDGRARRYYFAEKPVELEISNAPEIKEVEIAVHPNSGEKRKIKVDRISIAEKDYNALRGKEARLLHLYNIRLGKNDKAEFTSMENKEIQKIQWVSFGMKTRILMPDGKWVLGIAEDNIKELEVGSIIQFERFGFCRLDRINNDLYEFWYAHQ